MNPPLQHVSAGDVIRIRCGLYDHVALVSDRLMGGEIALISISAQPGHVFEQRFSELVGNRSWKNEGYPGALPPSVVLHRARQMAHRPYSLTSWNCEHFVRWAHGLPAESPQLQWGVVLMAGLGLMVALA